jgi:quercetin dioxygenase-like cupin family protein
MSKNPAAPRNNHPDMFNLFGELLEILIPGSQTGNQFSLVEGIFPPGASSPLHRHIREDQAITVLEGEVEIVIGPDTFSFTKGATYLIPRGTAHRELNHSHSENRFLMINSPGSFSEFVRLAGTRVASRTRVPPRSTPTAEQIRKVMELALEFGTEILTPLENLVSGTER